MVRPLLVVVLGAALSGCISPRSFVDPAFPKVSYDEVHRVPAPPRLTLVVEFRRNGEAFGRADSTLRDVAERVLRASGAFVPVADGDDGEIRIVVDNIADRGAAAAKGFGTGLTFGLVGSTVTDAYEMSVYVTTGGRTASRTAVTHAFHTAIGNTTIPSGIETMPPGVAFQRVIEQMLLRVLREMQGAGEIAGPRPGPAEVVVGSDRRSRELHVAASTRTAAAGGPPATDR